MQNRLFSVFLSLAVTLSGCQMIGGQGGTGASAAREGYFSWVDEQGRVRHTPIPDSKAKRRDSASRESDASSTSNPDGKSSPAAGASPQTSGTPHEEFNLANYPDGDELEKRGHIRPGDPEPYFTWRDAEDNVRVSYYRPDTRSAVEKGEILPPIRLTEASVYFSSESPTDSPLPDTADLLAAAVMGLDQDPLSFFDRWREACCDNLERSGYLPWEPDREFGVKLEKTSATHEFSSGSSHYVLVSLPFGDDFILRLRSFDQQGLFVPSVAFLDDEFKPLRIVTDLIADYLPENWLRHGFLRSYVPVFPSRGERWLLIYTTPQDVDDQTVTETRFGPRAIPHQPTGELGLSRVAQ